MNKIFTTFKNFLLYSVCFGLIGVVSSFLTDNTQGGLAPTVNADAILVGADPDGSCDGSPSPSGDCGCGY